MLEHSVLCKLLIIIEHNEPMPDICHLLHPPKMLTQKYPLKILEEEKIETYTVCDINMKETVT